MSTKPFNVEGRRILAQRRLPKISFDYLEGSANDETGLNHNHEVCERYRLTPATVDRDHGLGEQVQPSAKDYELAAGRPDRWPVVLAEIGNGLEIRHEASGQPHQFDVTLGLPLQAPARLHAVEIAV